MPKARDIAAVARILTRVYGDWDHNNKRNPLDELIFIVCSVQTTERGYERTFKSLRREFPTFDTLAEAPARYLAKPLKPGGLSRVKSRALRKVFDRIEAEFGRLTLAPLRNYDDDECESFLMSLPGVGRKVARCVMMYSLDREVFPVDTHCWRVARRLGWVRPTTGDGHCSDRDMDRLQEKIAPEHRFSLHVNFVSLGREHCTATRPRCGCCPVAKYCRRVGVRY
jgi:endonuclease III